MNEQTVVIWELFNRKITKKEIPEAWVRRDKNGELRRNGQGLVVVEPTTSDVEVLMWYYSGVEVFANFEEAEAARFE